MFFKMQVVTKKNENLLESLSEYQNNLERGNYKTLSTYASEWKADDVWATIADNLSIVYSETELADFSAQLKEESPTPFALIAQFFASLFSLKTQKQDTPENQLSHLQRAGTMLYVEAGMPTICFVYLNAIESSSLSPESKLSALSQFIIALEKNKQHFGTSRRLVIQVSVQRWLALFEQLDPGLIAYFTPSKVRHEQCAKNCLSLEEVQTKLTIIELYTLKILGKINIIQNEVKNREVDKQGFFPPQQSKPEPLERKELSPEDRKELPSEPPRRPSAP